MLVTSGWMLVASLLLPNNSLVPAQDHPADRNGPVSVWTDRDDPYRRGEGARVYIHAARPSHVAVFRVDTDGRIRVLFPRDPWGDTFVRDERTFEVSGSRGGRSFMVDDYPGIGYLFVVASAQPLDFEDITRGDYWDYRLIGGGRLQGDPYVLLADLAGRITRGGNYDSDVAPYYVDRRYEYPRFVCYDCHAYASYAEWDPYERACSRYRIEVYDDPSRYPYGEGRGRHAVAPSRYTGPVYVFRDADPRRDYVTRPPRAPEQDRLTPAEGRTSEDVGGRGSIPAPGLQSLGRRSVEPRTPEPSPARPRIEERRRQSGEGRSEPGAGGTPEGLRPAERDRRMKPQPRPAEPPQSTGEPELRRRRP
jgi:Domain of unknown function (DUF4384)